MSRLGDHELRDAAVSFARKGWRVIPLYHVREYGKPRIDVTTADVATLDPWLRQWAQPPICSCWKREACRVPGKHPMIKDWRENASNDPVLVAEWWRCWRRSNIGLLTGGAARLVAIDIDGAIGRESLTKLEATYEPLPDTLRQTTGREGGGEHFLLTVDDDFEMDKIRNRTKMAPGIDVRAEGGLIVASPSIHPTGAQYAWRDPSKPVASMPAWLIKIATSQKARQIAIDPNKRRPTEAALEADGWPYARRVTVARTALRKADPAISQKQGHLALLKATVLLVRGYCLYSDEAFDLLWGTYNPICSPPWSEKELMHKIEDAEYEISDESYPWRYAMRVHAARAPDLDTLPLAEIERTTHQPTWRGGVSFRVLDGEHAGKSITRDMGPRGSDRWAALARAVGIDKEVDDPSVLGGAQVRVEIARHHHGQLIVARVYAP